MCGMEWTTSLRTRISHSHSRHFPDNLFILAKHYQKVHEYIPTKSLNANFAVHNKIQVIVKVFSVENINCVNIRKYTHTHTYVDNMRAIHLL